MLEGQRLKSLELILVTFACAHLLNSPVWSETKKIPAISRHTGSNPDIVLQFN